MAASLRLPGCIAALATAFAAVATGQTGAPQPRQTAKLQTGLIAGRVIEAGRNTPVEDAVVALRGPQATGQTESIRRVIVDSQGRFVFNDLPPGSYELFADQFGYMRGEYGKLAPEGTRLRVELGENHRLTDTPIWMWKLASISGRVVDESGEPVALVSVRALRRVWRHGIPLLREARSSSTDDRGAYRIGTLPPGDYVIAVPARVSTFPVDVYRSALTSASPFSLGVSEVSRLGDFRNLQIGSHVISTMSFAPIPPAPRDGRVTVFQTTYYPGTTASESAQVISLAAGEDRSAVDIRMVAVTAHQVSGRIMGPDGPVAMTPFRVLRDGGGGVSEFQDFGVATGFTAADGRFTLLGIPRGQLVLRLDTVGESGVAPKPGRPPSLYAHERFSVGDSDVTDLAVTARPPAVINATIHVRAPAKPPNEFQVVIQSYDDASVRVQNPRVSADRRFSAELRPGRYLVVTYDQSGTPCTSTAGGRTVSDSLLDVGTERTIDVSIVCAGASTNIAGTVRDSEGQFHPHARVIAFPANRALWSGAGYAPRRTQSARTTAQGTFSLRHLPEGEYFLAAVAEAAGVDAENPDVRVRLSQGATKITIAAGSPQSIDLRVQAIR